ncbi:MAG: SAM-dependent methyltransferase, partial [Cyanobacteria bacterium P01_A01_bin.40]
MKLGKLYGVSVGTGDPELITVKGLRILQNSHVIAFPAG